jgi:hypothetical protein
MRIVNAQTQDRSGREQLIRLQVDRRRCQEQRLSAPVVIPISPNGGVRQFSQGGVHESQPHNDIRKRAWQRSSGDASDAPLLARGREHGGAVAAWRHRDTRADSYAAKRDRHNSRDIEYRDFNQSKFEQRHHGGYSGQQYDIQSCECVRDVCHHDIFSQCRNDNVRIGGGWFDKSDDHGIRGRNDILIGFIRIDQRIFGDQSGRSPPASRRSAQRVNEHSEYDGIVRRSFIRRRVCRFDLRTGCACHGWRFGEPHRSGAGIFAKRLLRPLSPF